MHTDTGDQHGQPLEYLAETFGLTNGEIVFSNQKMPAEELAKLYNIADCTINISDAEGFGLATLESLSCGTPIIVNMTGGLQEQVTDGEEWYGIGIQPASKAIIGSQSVPYIYEDRISKENFLSALNQIYSMTANERKLIGMKGRSHVVSSYNFDSFNKKWVTLMDNIVERHGSGGNRKKYQSWEIKEIK